MPRERWRSLRSLGARHRWSTQEGSRPTPSLGWTSGPLPRSAGPSTVRRSCAHSAPPSLPPPGPDPMALTTIPPRVAILIPRLASDHEGERLATVAAIERALTAAGRDFHDLARALGGAPAPTECF